MLVAGCGLMRRSERPLSGPVNVNTAALADLERLPGVTPSMARRIYEGRPYGTLDELVERGLLSERELERVRKRITAGGAAQKKGDRESKPAGNG